MRAAFAARYPDIVMVTTTLFILLACILTAMAYLDIGRHSTSLSARTAFTFMRVAGDLNSADPFVQLRFDQEGVLRLSRRIGEARNLIRQGGEGSNVEVYSDHPNLAGASAPSDDFRVNALRAIRNGESKFEGLVSENGRDYFRVAAPLLATQDCAGCLSAGLADYKKGDTIGIREVAVPVDGDQTGIVGKLKYALATMFGALLVFLGLVVPMTRHNRSERVKMRNLADSLEVQASTDPLTGLKNRRYFESMLDDIVSRFNEEHAPLGLLVFDLDHFKKVNDTHGHDTGDLVLREVALRLRAITRDGDVVARIGGEEFAVIAPNASLDQCRTIAERYRDLIGSLRIDVGKVVLRPTISIGIATNAGGEMAAGDLFKAADRKLYEAKHAGRNRVAA